MNILIVEDDLVTGAVLRKMLRGLGHTVAVAYDGLQAWELYHSEGFPFVISDWMMPGIDGVEFCRRVRCDFSHPYTYFIMTTSRDAREDRLAGLEAGADDFVVKPFELADLTARVRIAERIIGMRAELSAARDTLEERVQRRTEELAAANQALSSEISERKHAEDEVRRAYAATIDGWSRALELRDRETEGHTRRVTEITLEMAKAAGFTGECLMHIRHGALLHDIGKMGVPDSILLKPGPLTPQERLVVERHPDFAHDLLNPIEFLEPALTIPYGHHERWDGTGYPRGLRGDKIPLEARLFAIADVWDAMRSNRPYREGWPFERVVAHIMAGQGTHFDPWAVELFLQLVESGKLLEIEKGSRQQPEVFPAPGFAQNNRAAA